MSHLPATARILVIDDSNVARLLLIKQLKELGFYYIVEAANAEQAMQVLLASRTGEPFSLIVTDLRMPGIQGNHLIENLQMDPDFKAIPKLVSSVETDRGVVLDALRSGAAGYILKPTTIPVLREKLAKLFLKESKLG
jgi:two-component system, chemotaxis family, chemotaxis protein CheY